jgi:hypothetical protein
MLIFRSGENGTVKNCFIPITNYHAIAGGGGGRDVLTHQPSLHKPQNEARFHS